MNVDELLATECVDRTMHETQTGRATAQLVSALDAGHPMIPFRFAEIRPAAVIITPLEWPYGHSPAYLPDVRFAAVRSSLVRFSLPPSIQILPSSTVSVNENFF